MVVLNAWYSLYIAMEGIPFVKACTPVGQNLINGQGYFKVAWLIC